MPIGKGPALSPLKKEIERPSVITPRGKTWERVLQMTKVPSPIFVTVRVMQLSWKVSIKS